MNFLHISDLHIGKRLCGRPRIDDQRHVLREILDMAASADVDAVLVAGDLYDKSQPGGEAVELASAFLSELAALNKPAFIVSGNHDSAEQVAYCRSILAGADIHVSSALVGAPEPVVLSDEWGEVNIYLLPFVRPAQARRAFPERAGAIGSYADALRVCVEEMHIDPVKRNVLVAHQFVVGGEMVLTDSEDRMVGGVDAVPAAVFDAFDYVALGHLHAPQRAGSERIRYAGSPLKYSVSEERQRKAALRVSLGEKGKEPEIEALSYHPLREVRSIRGTLRELILPGAPNEDYVFVTLTDELPPIDPVGALLESYPNFMQLRLENSRTGGGAEIAMPERMEELSPLEHFLRFYATQNNGQSPTDAQLRLLKRAIEEAEVNLRAPS